MAYSLQPKKLPLNFTVLVPFIKFTEELERELLLLNIKTIYANENFIIVSACNETPIWCQAVLRNCRAQEIESKNSAIQYLKKHPVRGVYFETSLSAKLGPAIKSELRELKLKRLKFEAPSSFNFKYFVWGMLDAAHIFICDEPGNQFPLGWHEFDEDKEFPPNRAYLKLWELLTLGHINLSPNDVAVDLGASPGGWSWVLSRQVKKVYSVDRAPLAPQIAKLKNIEHFKGDAFSCDPKTFKDCTWMFSDIICTPEKLLGLVQSWITKSPVQNYVCTIKFKGQCNFDILKKFKSIEGSSFIRLYQNKNELTWMRKK